MGRNKPNARAPETTPEALEPVDGALGTEQPVVEPAVIEPGERVTLPDGSSGLALADASEPPMQAAAPAAESPQSELSAASSATTGATLPAPPAAEMAPAAVAPLAEQPVEAPAAPAVPQAPTQAEEEAELLKLSNLETEKDSALAELDEEIVDAKERVKQRQEELEELLQERRLINQAFSDGVTRRDALKRKLAAR